MATIFITVGAQMPFDRLIRACDAWAAEHLDATMFAQIGANAFRPSNIAWTSSLDPDSFRYRVESADLVVAHAGMGSILTALELGRRILVMPRRGDLGETRNDHQIATARALEQQGHVSVAYDQAQLLARLDRFHLLPKPQRISSHASPQLINVIRSFIDSEDTRARKPRNLLTRIIYGGLTAR
jgi:UDP-N-acetylglucosamine transferase subunit ALG13